MYGTNNVDKSNPLPDGIPSVCDTLLDHIQKEVMFRPDQMTVNEYKPGQGMIWQLVEKVFLAVKENFHIEAYKNPRLAGFSFQIDLVKNEKTHWKNC